MARKSNMPKTYTRPRHVAAPKQIRHRIKLKVKKDDVVEVISGSQKGSRGRVLRALPLERSVVIEGVNKRWKHLRRSQENPQGGRIHRELPISVSKIRKVEG